MRNPESAPPATCRTLLALQTPQRSGPALGRGPHLPRARRCALLVAPLAAWAAVSLTPRDARADSALSNDGSAVSYQPPPAERRDGFTIGLVQHMGLTSVRGYPNELAAIGDPAREASTGAQFGQSGSWWLGGALRDWLTVGVGLASATTFDDQPQGVISAFVLHLEGFPGFSLGGAYRDLGVFLDVGTGFGAVLQGGDAVAEGGSLAYFGGGVFYEPFRFWHFSTGPSLTYSHQFSDTLSAHAVGLGWRFVFYGVQPG